MSILPALLGLYFHVVAIKIDAIYLNQSSKCLQYCFLLLMKIDVVHKIHPTDSHSQHYEYITLDWFLLIICSPCTTINLCWTSLGFLPMVCKNLIIISNYVCSLFMAAAIFILMPHCMCPIPTVLTVTRTISYLLLFCVYRFHNVEWFRLLYFVLYLYTFWIWLYIEVKLLYGSKFYILITNTSDQPQNDWCNPI